MHESEKSEEAQSCPTLSDPMDCPIVVYIKNRGLGSRVGVGRDEAGKREEANFVNFHLVI